MITKNPMQLKAFIKKKAAEKKISAQLVMQNYMLERLLERISLSAYKQNFILKGGFLISAIVGLDTRATMDLDTTIKGFTLTHEAIRRIFEEICAVEVADDVRFELVDIADIREGDDYPGIRVSLKANYPPISVPLTVDVTPHEKSNTLFLCCLTTVPSASLPTTLKPYWQRKLKPYCPAVLPTRAREIFMTYIFYILCGVLSVIHKHCFRPRSAQPISEAVKKFSTSIRILSPRFAPANSFKVFGKNIREILTMQKMSRLMMLVIRSSVSWTP